ncbi:hypothetical protein [Marinirhabdus gelatinilytica]|uniref:Uncharacterized protein n=1 Tax=Marinirhabdus gelatinilytica TaxID=1703343 RepID=A0A370QB27_9FLAO|nr:hypothetical protein [Marinirhabdus gelatinilytica]RDK85585.1 hypothetical protein C8D94_103412 [Marinirhabdus gelatinilytica]
MFKILTLLLTILIFSCSKPKEFSFKYDDFDLEPLKVSYIVEDPIYGKKSFIISDTSKIKNLFKSISLYSKDDFFGFIEANYTTRFYQTKIKQNGWNFELNIGIIEKTDEKKSYLNILSETESGYYNLGNIYDETLINQLDSLNPYLDNDL